MSQWQYAHNEQLGAKNGQIVFIESYDDRAGGLTYNATTPYVLPFIDLADGPWIAVMPEGEVRGAAHDIWQIGITQLTEPGKYLFVGPGQETPKGAEAAGYRVFSSPTNSLLLGIRLMPTDRDERSLVRRCWPIPVLNLGRGKPSDQSSIAAWAHQLVRVRCSRR